LILLDDDNDNIPDDQDAFPLDSNESEDTDGDGVGNNTDLDDDGDGILDSWEFQYGLDPLDSSDAGLDSDNDGETNLVEFNNNGDPTKDTVAPEIHLEAELWVDATGLYTKIEPGTVSAHDFKDGDTAVSLIAGEEYLLPGRHVFTYSATDLSGNTNELDQIINVQPIIEFVGGQTVREGNDVEVRLILNGPSPVYPLAIPYTVAGTAFSDLDHDLYDGYILIAQGMEGKINFSTYPDTQIEGDEELTLTLQDEGLNLGDVISHQIIITEEITAPDVSLSIVQDEEVRTWLSKKGGAIHIAANVDNASESDTYDYAWTLPEELAYLEGSGSSISFDADELNTGVQEFTVTVTNAESSQATATTSESLLVKWSLPILDGEADTDEDGIADADESFTDTDVDGIPDYLDHIGFAANVISHKLNEGEVNWLESDAGTRLSLGRVSRQTERFGVLLSETDMRNASPAVEVPDNVGGVFDFEVHDLPKVGQIVNVVVPLREVIPDNAIYQGYRVSSGWEGFAEDANNSIASAPGAEGFCPSPGDLSYTPGLTTGDWCVQLSIQDGGVNDKDATANGRIAELGGMSIEEEEAETSTEEEEEASAPEPTLTPEKSSGGGAFDWWFALLALIGLKRRQSSSRQR